MSEVSVLCQQTETSRRCAVALFKKFAEIAGVIETTGFADRGEIMIRTGQQIGGPLQPVTVQILRGSLRDAGLKAAEAFSPADTSGLGNLIYGKRFVVVFLDKSQHLVHALFLREDGLRGARSTDFSEHLRQLPPDAAEQFHTVKLVVVIHGVQCVKFTEKSQDGEIFFLFCREEGAENGGVQDGQNNFLVCIAEGQRRKQADGNTEEKDFRSGLCLSITVKNFGVDKKPSPA